MPPAQMCTIFLEVDWVMKPLFTRRFVRTTMKMV